MKALIIDDEKVSRDVLTGYIQKYCPGVSVAGEAENIDEAKKLIGKLHPDLLFLDIEMPRGNGFDLLEQLPDTDLDIIFVTAFNDYAMKALNLSAAYYILKPVSIEELVKAVEKVKKLREDRKGWAPAKVLLENLSSSAMQNQKVVLPLLNGFEIVKVGEIVHCKANDNFTEFHLLSGKKIMICRTLKYYEELLAGYDFARVHKSHLVNKNHIKRYLKGKGGSLVMIDNTTIDVSPTYKDSLLSDFS